MPCPICSGPMSVTHGPGQSTFVDCAAQHHGTTDAAIWENTRAQVRIAQIEDFIAEKAQQECPEHTWRTRESNDSLTLMECTTCLAWALESGSRGRHPSSRPRTT